MKLAVNSHFFGAVVRGAHIMWDQIEILACKFKVFTLSILPEIHLSYHKL
jgi:hypothetical protein